MYPFNIKNKIVSTEMNNSINFNEFLNYFFNDFSLLNFINIKNIFLGYNYNIFFNSSLTNINIISQWFEVQNTTENLIYSSLLLDYYNYLNNIYFLCFNFNNNLKLENLFNNYYLNSYFNLNFSYKFLEINFFKNQFINYNSWFLLLIIFFLLYFFLIIFYFIFTNKINILFKNEKIYDEYNTIVNYLIESEKELGSLDDMFVGISILMCIYGWFFFGTIFFNFFSSIGLSYMYVGFPIFIFIVLGMPTNMIWNYGILYPVYLRGSSNTTIFILEFMYDILATGIMYIRLIVQNVRFILMFFAFFECYEFFFNFLFIIKNYYFFDSNYTITYTFYNFFLSFFNFVIFYVYNLGHLIYTIISHFFAYLVLVFWFFSFLYTTFLEEKLEIYFKIKR